MDTIVTPVTVITLDSTRIVHSIKADLVARYFPPVVRLVQYDMSLPVIAVSLMQNGQTYTLPSGAAANIRVHKPDATYVYNPALGCDSTRNIVYFEVTQAMAASNGDGLAIVEIVVDGDIAGTSLITLHFEENPVPEEAIESSDEWETIYELGERIIASTVTPVSTAAGMTDHNVVYLYTGTESGWNQGHMYYYNGTTWVDAGIAVTDTTLSVAGLAADAKKTGDEIADLKDGLSDLETQITATLITDTASGAIASFPDGADNVPVKSLKVNVEPVQDLHGYDNPWAGGAGKNKLPMTVAGIKAANTSGTWSGNVYSINGGTFTIITDADGNVTGINANGTFTSTSSLVFINNSDMTTGFARSVLGQTIVLNGCPSRTGNPYVQMFNTWGTTSAIYDNGSGIAQLSIPSTVSGFRCEIQMYAGTVSNVLFKPMIRLASVSDATFAPYSNICPISGHSTAKVTRLGKNLLKMRTTKATINGITIEPDGNGYVNISGTTGSSSYTYDLVDMPNAELTALFAMGGEYTLSLNKGTYNSTTLNLSVTYKETENGSTKYLVPNEHKTVPVGSIFLRASVWIPANTTPQQLTGFAIQLERNDTVTEFAPYQCQTVTIDLNGTRYGGTLNVETGVLTVDRAFIASYNGETLPSTWISDRDVYAAGTTPTTGAQVCYKLATPQIVQLTANEISTLLGQNNIWNDCGNTNVEYRADTKLYIEKLTAPTEDDMIADHAISANTFFMVGNQLFRATTAIASGATITVGTNATRLSLSDALNTLS